MAKGQLREKIPQLERALAGRLGAPQRFLIAQPLVPIDFLDERIGQVSKEIGERLRPCEDGSARLDTIPGMDRRGAGNVLAEIGTDLGRLPSVDHLAAWARMVPGNHESAGKRRSGKTRKGDPWLRSALIQAAHGAGRTKSTDLGAQDRRLAARRGKNKAAVAVGLSILVIVDHLLTRQINYQDLGPHSFAERDREGVTRRLVRRLEDLGDQVSVERAPVAA